MLLWGSRAIFYPWSGAQQPPRVITHALMQMDILQIHKTSLFGVPCSEGFVGVLRKPEAWGSVQLHPPTDAEVAALQKGEDLKSLERAGAQPQAAGKGRHKGGPGAAQFTAAQIEVFPSRLAGQISRRHNVYIMMACTIVCDAAKAQGTRNSLASSLQPWFMSSLHQAEMMSGCRRGLPRMQKRRADQECKSLQLHALRSPLLHTGMHLCAAYTQWCYCGWQSQQYCVRAQTQKNAGPKVWTHAKAWLQLWCRDHTVHVCMLTPQKGSSSVRHAVPSEGLNALMMQGPHCGSCAQPPGHSAGWRDRLWQDHAGAPVHPGGLLGWGLSSCICGEIQSPPHFSLPSCDNHLTKHNSCPAMPLAEL